MDEKKAMDEYAELGVELPELTPTETAPAAPVKPEEKPEVDEPKEIPKEEDKEPTLEESPEDIEVQPKKRSIYDEYKDKKREVKTERELREQAERERDEALRKLQERDTNIPPKQEDELSEFAKKIGADPETLREMQQLLLKGVEQHSVSPEIMESMNEFKNWQKQNSAALEEQHFNREFEQSIPTIEREFQEVDNDEMKLLRKEINRLAHTKEYHDKEIDYIIFKERDTLSKLVSPKKAGLEPKRKPLAPSKSEFTFDPNADISKMSVSESEAWEKEYNRLSKSTELVTDSEGRKILI